jgi:hypothetical protein
MASEEKVKKKKQKQNKTKVDKMANQRREASIDPLLVTGLELTRQVLVSRYGDEEIRVKGTKGQRKKKGRLIVHCGEASLLAKYEADRESVSAEIQKKVSEEGDVVVEGNKIGYMKQYKLCSVNDRIETKQEIEFYFTIAGALPRGANQRQQNNKNSNTKNNGQQGKKGEQQKTAAYNVETVRGAASYLVDKLMDIVEKHDASQVAQTAASSSSATSTVSAAGSLRASIEQELLDTLVHFRNVAYAEGFHIAKRQN